MTMENEKGFNLLKGAVSLVVAGFAAVISFVGLKGVELTAVLRNQEIFVSLMGLCLLLAVVTAIVSIFVPIIFAKGRTLNHGQELFCVLVLIAIGPLIIVITPISLATKTSERWDAVCVFLLILSAAFVILYFGSSGGKEGGWHRSKASVDQFFVFLVIVSLLFTSLGIYMALRVEARSQISTGASLQATLADASATNSSPGDDTLVITISSSKLPTEDYVAVLVTGLPRAIAPKEACMKVKDIPTQEPCVREPCSYESIHMMCDSIASWVDPPDATGDVNRQIKLPLQPAIYGRIHIQDTVCERATRTSACDFSLAPSSHLDLAVPSS
jgi:hypothetical protein